MKKDMYTYHYYKNRSIIKGNNLPSFLFSALMFSAFAYMVAVLFAATKF